MPIPTNLHWKYFFDYFQSKNQDYLTAYLKTPTAKIDLSRFNNLSGHKRDFLDIKPAVYSADIWQVLKQGKPDQRFTLTTTYPGLLVGSGYRHETNSDDELKLGFSFDFTTGLPIIPGSSIKGLLRSAFPGKPDNPLHARADGFIRYLLRSPDVNVTDELDDLFVQRLERELFEGQVPKDLGSTTHKDIPMGKRDVFYDALIGIEQNDTVYQGKLFGNDFITPHRNRNNPKMSQFINPVPIQFLKVLPNVPVTFQFGLQNREGQLLTPYQRLNLFNAIISELGVGAKTRVGYGQLV